MLINARAVYRFIVSVCWLIVFVVATYGAVYFFKAGYDVSGLECNSVATTVKQSACNLQVLTWVTTGFYLFAVILVLQIILAIINVVARLNAKNIHQ